jgi:HK97 family phage major capsid protein
LAGTSQDVSHTGQDTFAEITETALIAVMAKVAGWARRGSKWYISASGNDSLFQRLAADSGGTTMTEAGSKVVTLYKGAPVVLTEVLPSQTEEADDAIACVFGDLRRCVAMGNRRDIRVMVDPYSLSSYDQIQMTATSRYDIVVHDTDGLAMLRFET